MDNQKRRLLTRWVERTCVQRVSHPQLGGCHYLTGELAHSGSKRMGAAVVVQRPSVARWATMWKRAQRC